jgi:hemerythrin-like metal-binding protein
MRSLKWSTSHAVFVTEIDDEHKEIFEELSNFQAALSENGASAETGTVCLRLATRIKDHFAHEERLMRAARYGSLQWHKRKHDSALQCVGEYMSRLDQGDREAGAELVEYLTSWLKEHTRLADRMLGAFLRNHQRGLYKMTFRAGTKPVDACTWLDSRGDRFDPTATNSGY